MGLTQVFIFAVVVAVAVAAPRAKRVVGGAPYKPGEFKFHVSLWYMGDNNRFTYYTPDRHHTCGGSLLTPEWVLTSAICFDDNFHVGTGNLSLWQVVVGMYNQMDAENEAQFLEISEIFVVPQYDLQRTHGDLALLKLSTQVNMNDPRVGTVDVNVDQKCPVVDQKCTVIGWGQMSDQTYGQGSYLPNAAEVDVQDLNICKHVYEAPWIRYFMGPMLINEENICAGVFPLGGKDGCHGDAGSPLLCSCGKDGQLELAGTDSTGFGCARAGFAGVYTNVASFASWIHETIADNS